ncbi:MAG: hypothetical protein HUU26_11805 [Gemmatimonadaceae bacterium]|nr:hypothetical protein [Gemmatimonadaceae bacterium]
MSPSTDSSRVVVTVNSKSIGVAIVLTVLFGPVGMLYSTVPGALIMMIVSAVVGIFTLGFGLLFTWPICIVWGVMAANAYNKQLLTGARG